MKAAQRTLLLVLATAGLVTLWLVPAAQAAPTQASASLDAGCDQNGLPNSVALCEGTGRFTIKLSGNAVLNVREGWVGLSGKAKAIKKKKKKKKRVRTTRRKPIVPDVPTFRRGKYTVYTGRNLYFYLPPGTWRVVADGVGLSASAVGKGHVNLRARPQRRREDPDPQQGLISVAGASYIDWPSLWRFFRFGRDVPTPELSNVDTERRREGSVSRSVGDQ